MPKKLTQEEVDVRDISVNMQAIEPYKNCLTLRKYICPICKQPYLSKPSDIWGKKSTKCIICHKNNRPKKQNSPFYTGYYDISGRYWALFLKSANKRNRVIAINIEDVWNQYIIQNKRCALSGVNISFEYYDGYKTTASIDRINSKLNYTSDNIQVVHPIINRMKFVFSQKKFIDLCTEITRYSKLQKRIEINNNPKLQSISSQHFNFKGYNNISLCWFNQYKKNSKKRTKQYKKTWTRHRNLSFKIIIQQIDQIYNQQNGKCILSGRDISCIRQGSTASLDRIDSSKGYIINNVQLIHKEFQTLKGYMSQEEFLYWCKLVAEYSAEKLDKLQNGAII